VSKTASPTRRTLELFREDGWHIDVSEYFNYFSKQRKDLFGFMDLVAFGKTIGILGIQCTTTGNLGAREAKILDMGEKISSFLECSNRVILVGWKKYAKPIDRKWWRPTIREIISTPISCKLSVIGLDTLQALHV